MSRMQNLNSDQLRRQLDENNAAMNILTDDNQKIVELLAQRGLKAIEPDNNDVAIHPCVMQLDKLGEALFRTQFEPKRREEIALTAEELKAGGWWCDDVSAECEMAFKSCGLDVVRDGWGGIGGHIGDCCILGHPKHVSRAWIKSIVSGEKQIHRIGNEFYWGDA